MNSAKQRSPCPINASLEVLGDRWTLLLLRDLLFVGKSAYGEFMQSQEKIATNILANRLTLLENQGIVTKAVAADKKSKFRYRLTEKGLDLAPLLVELLLWGARYGQTTNDPVLLEELRNDRAGTIEKYQAAARARGML